MDERIATSTSFRGHSLSPDVGRSPDVNGHIAPTKAVAKPFEWVQYGDPGARKRARAHVTRGYRRQQAEAAQLAKLQAGSKPKSHSVGPTQQSSPISAWEETPVEKANEKTAIVLHSQRHHSWPYDTSRQHSFSPFLQHASQSGNTDPFGALPIKLDASGHAIVAHCKLQLKRQ